MGTIQIDGSTPKLTIGNATAEDATILFDGNAQDFYIALDDSADDLLIGLGSTVGTTPIIAIDENKLSTFSGAITVGVDDTGHDVKFFGATASAYMLWDESADDLILAGAAGLTVAGATALNGDVTLGGTTPTLTIGDAGAEDTKIVFDGNAQDFHIGLDDSADDLVIGLGSSLGTTAHIICDEAGHVTMPLQPCFCATPGGSDINVNSNDHTVQFSVERFDLNADYNTGTYTFTAPVTGKYFMSMMFSHQDIVDNYCKVDFVSSNKTYTTYHEAGENSPINTMHYHAVIDMDASDTVYVNVNTEDDTNWNIRANEGQFSGYLVA